VEGGCIQNGSAVVVALIKHVAEHDGSLHIAQHLLHYLAFRAAVGHSALVQELIILLVLDRECRAFSATAPLLAMLADAAALAMHTKVLLLSMLADAAAPARHTNVLLPAMLADAAAPAFLAYIMPIAMQARYERHCSFCAREAIKLLLKKIRC
jgi:hypothetical protein